MFAKIRSFCCLTIAVAVDEAAMLNLAESGYVSKIARCLDDALCRWGTSF